uniref:Claudin n=1 Tax=Amphilophus citrinellus TaxID=61819 RepID=A0A3Q0SML7_AMPCI
MRKRLIHIFGFLISSLGWLFVMCTLAMDYWRVSRIGGQGGSFIIKVAWYWSNLWNDCFTDSTAVTNCREYPVLWNIEYIQAVRGLLLCGMGLGFLAVTCCFIGMECTYIGGSDRTKDKVLFAGTVFHFAGGKL